MSKCGFHLWQNTKRFGWSIIDSQGGAIRRAKEATHVPDWQSFPIESWESFKEFAKNDETWKHAGSAAKEAFYATLKLLVMTGALSNVLNIFTGNSTENGLLATSEYISVDLIKLIWDQVSKHPFWTMGLGISYAVAKNKLIPRTEMYNEIPEIVNDIKTTTTPKKLLTAGIATSLVTEIAYRSNLIPVGPSSLFWKLNEFLQKPHLTPEQNRFIISKLLFPITEHPILTSTGVLGLLLLPAISKALGADLKDVTSVIQDMSSIIIDDIKSSKLKTTIALATSLAAVYSTNILSGSTIFLAAGTYGADRYYFGEKFQAKKLIPILLLSKLMDLGLSQTSWRGIGSGLYQAGSFAYEYPFAGFLGGASVLGGLAGLILAVNALNDLDYSSIKDIKDNIKDFFKEQVNDNILPDLEDRWNWIKEQAERAKEAIKNLPGIAKVVNVGCALLVAGGAASAMAGDLVNLAAAEPRSWRAAAEVPGSLLYHRLLKPLAIGTSEITAQHPIYTVSKAGALFFAGCALANAIPAPRRPINVIKQVALVNAFAFLPAITDGIHSLISLPQKFTPFKMMNWSSRVASLGFGVNAIWKAWNGKWKEAMKWGACAAASGAVALGADYLSQDVTGSIDGKAATAGVPEVNTGSSPSA